MNRLLIFLIVKVRFSHLNFRDKRIKEFIEKLNAYETICVEKTFEKLVKTGIRASLTPISMVRFIRIHFVE